VFSAATFSVKLGGGVAGWMSGVLLTSVGYEPNVEQTATALSGIVVLSSLIPGACALAAAGLVRLYSLTGTKLEAIQRELEARRRAETPRAVDAAS
jgi:GPH family glycoside/pentoside/hexuronide:cation symporter